MMDIKTVYKQLTNVDIEEQKQLWDERGKGYYGEFLLFNELYTAIDGGCKILMNLNVPVESGRTTEIDLLLIHETGLYVFEIKHYKGTIYGKDTDAVWTQYFRTSKNNSFKNPIEQNRYHIAALKKMFPEMPIHSCIVFTNRECDIRVSNENAMVDICKLHNVCDYLHRRFSQHQENYSLVDIDNIFNKLLPYSQIVEPITIDGKEAPFQSWVQPTLEALEKKREEAEKEKEIWKVKAEEAAKSKKTGIITNIIIAIACVIVSLGLSSRMIQSKTSEYKTMCEAIIQQKNDELNAFKQNFLHVNEIGNQYIDALNSYVNVSNVALKPLTDDAVSFAARIAMSNDTYGIALTENSKYIVMTTSGKVMEYNVFGNHLPYRRIANIIGKGLREYGNLAQVQFYGIQDTKQISYIKITGIELFKLDINQTVVKDGLEIELYKK